MTDSATNQAAESEASKADRGHHEGDEGQGPTPASQSGKWGKSEQRG